MKEKNFRRRHYCSSIAVLLALFVVCGSKMHAVNDTGPSPGEIPRVVNDSPQRMQGSRSGVMEADDFTRAASDELVGTWKISQIKVQKAVNGVSASENTYSPDQRFRAATDCPKKITFTAAGKVIFEYSGDRQSSEGDYTVEGNRITRSMPVAVLEYEYALTDANNIQLVSSYNYDGGSGNKVERITETYTFFGTKE